MVNYWWYLLLLRHIVRIACSSHLSRPPIITFLKLSQNSEIRRALITFRHGEKRRNIDARIAAATDGRTARTIERLLSREMESKIEEGIETTTTRKKQTNLGLKIDITTSLNQSTIPPTDSKVNVFYHWPLILWISKTVKHPSSLLCVEDFILWTPPPPIHNSPWNSWFFIIPVGDGCAQCDRKSVVTTKFSPFSHPCTVSQHKEGGLYITTATTLHVCVVLFDSCDSRVHLMNMSGHGDIFRCRSCWSDVLVGHVVLPTPPPSPHTH